MIKAETSLIQICPVTNGAFTFVETDVKELSDSAYFQKIQYRKITCGKTAKGIQIVTPYIIITL